MSALPSHNAITQPAYYGGHTRPDLRLVKSEQPSRMELHSNRPLSNLLLAEIQDDSVYACRQIFPSVPVQFQSDYYISMVKDAFYRTVAAARGPGAETPGTNYNIKNDNTYLCKVYGVHHDFADQTARNVDAQINAIENITKLLTKNLLLRQELDWNNIYFQPNIWTGFKDLNGNVADFDCSNLSYSHGQWDTANSDPISDIDLAKAVMLSQSGQPANTLVVANNVWRALKNHPLIVDKYKHVQVGNLTKQLVAAALEIDNLVVCEATINAASAGQTAKMGFIQSNSWLLCHVAPNPGIMVASAGYTFDWIGYQEGGLAGAVRNFRMEHLRSTRYEAEMAYDMQMTGSDLGIFGINVCAKNQTLPASVLGNSPATNNPSDGSAQGATGGTQVNNNTTGGSGTNGQTYQTGGTAQNSPSPSTSSTTTSGS